VVVFPVPNGRAALQAMQRNYGTGDRECVIADQMSKSGYHAGFLRLGRKAADAGGLNPTSENSRSIRCGAGLPVLRNVTLLWSVLRLKQDCIGIDSPTIRLKLRS
jgi:hypothetical protein